ncbi:MAG: hypothetical protein ACREKH_13245 [Candidatus Rokuibacteriota bacterium]
MRGVLVRLLAVAGVLLLLSPVTAHAYIDPGAGQILWQLLLVALFGALYSVRRLRQWFVAQCRRCFGRSRSRGRDETR